MAMRASAKNCSISLGLLQVTGDLVPTARRETSGAAPDGSKAAAPKLHSACPDCYAADPKALAVTMQSIQRFCNAAKPHGPFDTAECLKAAEGPDGLRVIGTKDDVKAAKEVEGADEDPTLELKVFPAAEVEEATTPKPDGVAYTFRTKDAKSPLMAYLVKHLGTDGRILINGESMVLVDEITLRGTRKLVQLRTWRGLVVLQELARPQDAQAPEAIDYTLKDQHASMIETIIATAATAFDPEAYTDDARERLAKFAAETTAKAAGVSPIKPSSGAKHYKKVDSSDDDVMALLEASLAQVVKDKATAA
jgi:hypothetical protein